MRASQVRPTCASSCASCRTHLWDVLVADRAQPVLSRDVAPARRGPPWNEPPLPAAVATPHGKHPRRSEDARERQTHGCAPAPQNSRNARTSQSSLADPGPRQGAGGASCCAREGNGAVVASHASGIVGATVDTQPPLYAAAHQLLVVGATGREFETRGVAPCGRPRFYNVQAAGGQRELQREHRGQQSERGARGARHLPAGGV